MVKVTFDKRSASAMLQSISPKVQRENQELVIHLLQGKPVRVTIETIEEE